MNSFTEWKKLPGNEYRTFDDYKRKKCYPSSRHKDTTQTIDLNGKLITDYSQKSYSNPYKKLYSSKRNKQKFQKRLYFYISIVVLFMILLFLNPGYDAHRRAFHRKIEKSALGYSDNVSSDIKTEATKENEDFAHESIIQIIERNIVVDDYLIFSITKVYFEGKSYPVGFGILEIVFISDNVSKLKLNKPI